MTEEPETSVYLDVSVDGTSDGTRPRPYPWLCRRVLSPTPRPGPGSTGQRKGVLRKGRRYDVFVFRFYEVGVCKQLLRWLLKVSTVWTTTSLQSRKVGSGQVPPRGDSCPNLSLGRWSCLSPRPTREWGSLFLIWGVDPKTEIRPTPWSSKSVRRYGLSHRLPSRTDLSPYLWLLRLEITFLYGDEWYEFLFTLLFL